MLLRELKGLILFLTHWIEASAKFVLLSKPHEYWRWRDHTTTYSELKRKCRFKGFKASFI